MRIRLDENLPESLLASLAGLGHEVDNVRLEGMAGRAHPDVWQSAQSGSRFLITQDLDFSDIRKFAPGTHHGLLLARMRLPGRRALARRLCSIFHTEAVETWTHCLVHVTDRKVRLHRPRTLYYYVKWNPQKYHQTFARNNGRSRSSAATTAASSSVSVPTSHQKLFLARR